eukprot:403358108
MQPLQNHQKSQQLYDSQNFIQSNSQPYQQAFQQNSQSLHSLLMSAGGHQQMNGQFAINQNQISQNNQQFNHISPAMMHQANQSMNFHQSPMSTNHSSQNLQFQQFQTQNQYHNTQAIQGGNINLHYQQFGEGSAATQQSNQNIPFQNQSIPNQDQLQRYQFNRAQSTGIQSQNELGKANIWGSPDKNTYTNIQQQFFESSFAQNTSIQNESLIDYNGVSGSSQSKQEKLTSKQSDEDVTFFLPNCINDEIEGKTTSVEQHSLFSNPLFQNNQDNNLSQVKQSTSQQNLPNYNIANQLPPRQEVMMGTEQFKTGQNQHFAQGFNQMPQIVKICRACGKNIQQSELSAAIDKGPGMLPDHYHLGCLQMFNQQQQMPQMISRPSISQLVQITPDMLVFDFQLLHPLTMTSVFQIQNQSPNYFVDNQKQIITFNKLLCSSTNVPFNIAIVNIKYDLLRDPQALKEQLSPLDPSYFIKIANLPQKPMTTNQIQGQINFVDLTTFNDKNVTITLRSNQQDALPNMYQKDPILHLNFNYNLFRDPQFGISSNGSSPISQENFQTSHIIRNVYMNLIISIQDFEIMKMETLRLISMNPALVQLIKQPNNLMEEHQKFAMSHGTSSLHQILQSSQVQNQMNGLTIHSSGNQFLNQNQASPQKRNSITDSYLKISNAKSLNSVNGSSQNSNSSVDQQEEEKQQNLLGKSILHSLSDSTDQNNFRVQRNNIGIEICNLKSQEEIEVPRRATADLTQVINDSNAKPFHSKQGFEQNRRSSNLSDKSAQDEFADLHKHPGKSRFLKPNTSKNQKEHNSKNSSYSQSSFDQRSPQSKGSVMSSQNDTVSLNEENSQLQNELKGRVVEMARQQYGSKQLQKLLAKASPDFVNFAIEESLYHLHTLMSDSYGNYFCQKLMQSSSSAQRLKILNVLRPNILLISRDKKGTHSMQCLIEMINMPEEEEELKKGIQDHIIDLAFDGNGTHVLQKVLLCMKEENIDFIINPILEKFIELSMDQNGLCVIKKIISKIQGHETKIAISKKLSNHVEELVQSPYGNYAVQQALEKWELPYCLPIFEKLEPHLMQLSVQKFSSNVIEKILEKAEYDTVERFMKKLCEIEVMKTLIKNTYGFYVMQKLVQILRKHNASTNQVSQAINETIQYATDRNLKQRWQQLLVS